MNDAKEHIHKLGNATTLRFSKKFDHPFSHFFVFCNTFPESHGFVAVLITSLNNFVSIH